MSPCTECIIENVSQSTEVKCYSRGNSKETWESGARGSPGVDLFLFLCDVVFYKIVFMQ